MHETHTEHAVHVKTMPVCPLRFVVQAVGVLLHDGLAGLFSLWKSLETGQKTGIIHLCKNSAFALHL